MKNFVYFKVVLVLLVVEIEINASGPCALLEPRPDALCIPLASINRAFRDARQYFGLKYPVEFSPHKIQHHLHEVDQLGMVLMQTTKYIAKEFQIGQAQIEKLLPQLDLELTDIWSFCPHQFRSTNTGCKLGIYREINGRCNNLNAPEWGADFTPFEYLLPADRPDGVEYPKDADGEYLPPARVVSSKLHQDQLKHDHIITIMLIAWGQIIDHDITLTAKTIDSYTQKEPDCCKYLHGVPNAKLHHNCFPIQIPSEDEFYSGHHQHCMNFARSVAGVRTNCRLGSRTSLNSVSSFLDASFVYGSEKHTSSKLRTGKYGMLDSLPLFHKIGLKDLLPLKLDHPDEGCIRPNDSIFCFLAGDHRANEQLVLTVLHTIFMREHNRIASQLARINLHWDDERLYQETRRIIIAITQHITYEEFLPMVLGKQLMKKFQISIGKEGFWNGYDPNVNPAATEEFITSAFRFGHSLLPHRIERWSAAHRFIESKELTGLIHQPFSIYEPGYVDTYILGMVNQLAQAMDEGVTDQVTTLLFKKPHKSFGMDLAAINIQRGRDHAIMGYTAYRSLCGLSLVKNWEDLIGIMRNDTVSKYKAIYRKPQDIDLWSGGVSEIPSHGSLVGPIFGCIIAKQFHALQYGDRYWYETPNLPSSFNEGQLREIKKVKLSRILCDNGDYIKNIQVYAMVLADPQQNPRVPCQGLVLPRIDLSKWHEHPPHQDYHHKHSSLRNHDDSYATLLAPKFDPNFLQESQDNNPSKYQPLLHETTGYEDKAPGYPEMDANIDSHPNTFIEDDDNSSHLPSRPINVDSNENYQNDYTKEEEEENYKSFVDYPPPPANNNGPEILENLEAPPVEYDNAFTPEDEYDTGHPPPNSPPLPKPQHHYVEPPPHSPPPRSAQHFREPNVLRRRHVNPFPDSPFPGMGGIFSPNPGYLVNQRFSIPRIIYKG